MKIRHLNPSHRLNLFFICRPHDWKDRGQQEPRQVLGRKRPKWAYAHGKGDGVRSCDWFPPWCERVQEFHPPAGKRGPMNATRLDQLKAGEAVAETASPWDIPPQMASSGGDLCGATLRPQLVSGFFFRQFRFVFVDSTNKSRQGSRIRRPVVFHATDQCCVAQTRQISQRRFG